MLWRLVGNGSGFCFPNLCLQDTIAIRVVQETVAQYRSQEVPGPDSLQSAGFPFATYWVEKTWQDVLTIWIAEVQGSWKGCCTLEKSCQPATRPEREVTVPWGTRSNVGGDGNPKSNSEPCLSQSHELRCHMSGTEPHCWVKQSAGPKD